MNFVHIKKLLIIIIHIFVRAHTVSLCVTLASLFLSHTHINLYQIRPLTHTKLHSCCCCFGSHSANRVLYVLNAKKLFEWEINIPSGETTVFEVAFRICFPATIHFISAGGFDGAVAHCSGTTSPTRASVAPVIVT